MKLKIYLDTLFVIHFCINGFVLFLGKRFLHKSVGILRLAAAAAISAGMSCLVVVLVSGGQRAIALFLYIAVSLLVIHMAYQTKTFVKTLWCFLVVHAILLLVGGSIMMLWQNVFSGTKTLHLDNLVLLFLLALVVLYLLKTKVYDWQETGNYMVEISIVYREHIWNLTGFYDSGNHLRDPVSADAVCILDYEVVKNVIPENVFQAESGMPVEVRMIPCHTIGKHTLLPAIYIDTLLIGKGKHIQGYSHVLCALYQGTLMQDGEVQMILHNSFQKQF